MTIKLHDVNKPQVHESVGRVAKEISGVEAALKNNPMPDELLKAVQQGVQAETTRGRV